MQIQKNSYASIITFGDGKLAYRRAARRVLEQSKDFFQFSSGMAITKNDLISFFPDESKLIRWDEPNLGHYAWKPLALKFALKNLNKNSNFIFYADSGSWVNYNSKSSQRLNLYLETAEDKGGLCFSSGFNEKCFTKMELINRLTVSNQDLDSPQLAGGIWLLERNTAENICNKWWELASNFELVNNKFNKEIQNKDFIAHRNDQSIFSILAKQANLPISQDDVEIHPHKLKITETELAVPIWAARHRSGSRSLSMNPIMRGIRAIEQQIP